MSEFGGTAVRRCWRTTLGAGVAAVAAVTASGAWAQQQVYDIPAQSAVSALSEFGRQAGVQIVAPAETLRGVRTPTLRGRHERADALALLIRGTDLEIASITGTTVVLRRRSPGAKLAGTDRRALANSADGRDPRAPSPDGTDLASSGATVLDDIVVLGVRASIRNSIASKERETRLTDSIQSEDLGRFPDQNLAQSLQRVPGVTLDRIASGAPLSITVRGLAPQFTRVEINGMGGATGGGGLSGADIGNDGRGFDFSLLPTEFFTSAVVAKSPQARDEEGGVAALIELSTPSPFDAGHSAGVLSVSGNWGERTDVSPRVTGLLSHRLSDSFGILLGAHFAQQNLATSTAAFGLLVPLSSVSANPSLLTESQRSALIPSAYTLFARDRSTDDSSLLATAEWRPGEGMSVRLDALYTVSDGRQGFTRLGYEATSQVGAPTSLLIDNGIATSGSFPTHRRARLAFEETGINDTLEQYTLRGEIPLGQFISADWTVSSLLGYNRRIVVRPFDQINFVAPGNLYSYSLGGNADGFATNTPGPDNRPTEFRLDSVFAAKNEGQSQQTDFQVDFVGVFGNRYLKVVRVGLKSSRRDSNVSEPFFGAQNVSATSTLAPYFGLQRFELDGDFQSNIYGIAFDRTLNTVLGGQDLLDQSNFSISRTQLVGGVIGSAASNALAASSISEKVTVAYFESDLEIGRLFLNSGARIVSTRQSSVGSQNVNGAVSPVSIENDYIELLPAFNARFDIGDRLFLRGAYSRVLSRPSLQALSPRESFNFTTLLGTRGNPELEPFLVDQFDLGLEWYFGAEGIVAFSLFSKEFSSIIATETVRLPRTFSNAGGNTSIVEFTQPFNTGAAAVEGFEITGQTDFFFLPGALAHFGTLINYTRLDANTVSVGTFSAQQTQPFPNLSPSSFNAGFYYDDGRIEARLNYSWRERFLQGGVNPATSLNQRDFGQLDLSANIRVRKQILLQIQAINLLDEELEQSQFEFDLPLARTNLERRVTLGVRLEF